MQSNMKETSPRWVVPLENCSSADVDSAGGKGANLGELIHAGLPVPPGFVVTTAAYYVMLDEGNIGTVLGKALRMLNGDDTEVPRTGESIRAALLAAPVPVRIADSILSSYRQLGAGPVAVRSSATAEDLPHAAFAGQQDTYLNILGESALLSAVRDCWASLWSDRAIAYRAHRHIDQQVIGLATIVQQMVPADTAGVMFTANPITGARDEIVIDASPGLGEAIVSGLVTPDHLIVDKHSFRIKEETRGRRETMIRARSGGGTESIALPDQASIVPALSHSQVQTLARLGLRIEEHFHSPQDIEWAFSGRKPFILQSRPITALPSPAPRSSKPQQLVADLFAEMMPERPYPADVSIWVPALFGAIEPMFALIGLKAIPAQRLFIEEDGVVVRLSGTFPYRPTPAILLAPFRLIWMIMRYKPVDWKSDPLLAGIEARIRDLQGRDPRTLTWPDLVKTVKEAGETPRAAAGELRRRYLVRAALAAGLLLVMLALVRRTRLFATFLFGAENETIATNRELGKLAEEIRTIPALKDIFEKYPIGEIPSRLEYYESGGRFLHDLNAFLERHGHREGAALLVSMPTWKDAPEIVLGMLQGLSAASPRPSESRPAWQVAQEEILQRPLLRLPFMRRVFLEILAEAQCLIQIREDTHLLATASMPIIRRILIEMGRRLKSIGMLETPEQVFNLNLGELEQIASAWPPPPQLASQLRDAVQRREIKRLELQRTPVIDPRIFPEPQNNREALLVGSPGSPGAAEGPVCIVHDASEFGKLCAGDILVAPFTNPAWTPLFQRAAAVVVDTGSAVSHAAIIAREYGIPAVMGTRQGTLKLIDNQRVRVDGTRGLVLAKGEE